MKPLLTAILLTFLCNVCHSQGEFSNVALTKGFIFNLDFETVIPTANQYKSGQFAISDADGNLQLYGDASHVYDSGGGLIYNCEIEHGLSSASWVVANPKNNNQFYVFNTYENSGSPDGHKDYMVVAHYFVIDIDDNNHTVIDNIVYMHGRTFEYDSYCHTSCVVRHPDGDKLWFVIRNGKDEITSFLIEEGDVVSMVSSTIEMPGRSSRDFTLAVKTNPRRNTIFLPNGRVLNIDGRTGRLSLNDQFIIPAAVDAYEFSQSGKYLYCTKHDEYFFYISRYKVQELEHGIAGGEEIIYKGKVEYSGRGASRTTPTLFRHPNSTLYCFCYNYYISKLEDPDSETPVFVPYAVELPSKLDSKVPFAHYLRFSSIPCAAPRIIPE